MADVTLNRVLGHMLDRPKRGFAGTVVLTPQKRWA